MKKIRLNKTYRETHNICEWCGCSYLKGYPYFYEIELFGTDKHIICEDCKNHLRRIKDEKYTQYTPKPE